MNVEILDARAYDPADVREIAELMVRVWPKSPKTVDIRRQQLLDLGRGFQGPDDLAPRSFIVRSEGRIVAHAALLPRTIGTSAGDFLIAGLSRVCSAPELRGTGLGETVVRAAWQPVDDGTYRWSLFQTSRAVQSFYERLGAVEVQNPIVNSLADDPQQPAFWDDVVMRYPSDTLWPEGTIDLRGPGY